MEKNEKKDSQVRDDKKDKAAADKAVVKKPFQQQASQQVILGADGKEIRGIIRLAGKDIKGQVSLSNSLTRVKGIGVNLAKAISSIVTKELGVQPSTMVGELDEKQVGRLEYVLSHPSEFGVPSFMLNRQKDIETGENIHLIGTDLTYRTQQDIGLQRDIYTWRGYRHAYGQKVRGQRTRTTGRTGMTVGVLRKSIMAKAGGAAAATTGAAAQAAGAAPVPGAKPAAGAPRAAVAAAGAKPAAGAAPKAAAAAKPAAKATEKK